MSGAESVEDAILIRKELCGLLAKAGMLLRKWRSNSTAFLEDTPPELRETEPDTTLTLQESPKALGTHWETTTDSIQVAVPTPPSDPTTITKRVVASVSASIFDIMGLYSPYTVIPKMLLQEAWKLHLQWDNRLPDNLLRTWDSWVNELHFIQEHKLPRRYFTDQGPDYFQSLHGFSDASEKAYGAAVYLRTLTTDGTAQTALVTAKARVLPTKHITIPRAELVAAHLLSKLLAHVAELLQISPHQLHAWTDSAIVLHWLSNDSTQHKDRFVANRVRACKDNLPHVKWKHTPSAENPADLASRGVPAQLLVTSTLWWNGPSWLSGDPAFWPTLKLTRPPEAIQVVAIAPALNLPSSQSTFLNELWNRCSSLHLLERVVARIYHFTHCKSRVNRDKPTALSGDEVTRAKLKLLSLAQQQAAPEVFAAIQEGKRLPSNHPLSKFVITTKDGIITLHTRVRDLHSPARPTTLLPLHPKSGYTRLLCNTMHRTKGHPGVSTLHAVILTTYFIPGLRNLLKQLSRACTVCQRAYAQPLTTQMGLLPSNRTTPRPPFTHTGVDFAGPFFIRQGHVRKPVPIKAYASLFICLTTKAIHIELCSSLSSVDFRTTLQRFVARRGSPLHIYSDNGSNFVGAREETRELRQLLSSSEEMISTYCQATSITWHNIPARSPHFGGIWEAGVKAMKVLLRKHLTPHLLRYEELSTILCEVEAILNSRPLTPINEDDAAAGSVLTPAHFLLGRPLLATPLLEACEAKLTSLRRWKLVSRLQQTLWQQWLTQYISTLHQRTKWLHTNNRQLKVGDLVYIKDESMKQPLRHWPLARVSKTFPGDDGQVRAVLLRCGNGREYSRAVNMLVPVLPESAYTDKEEQ